MSDGSMKRLASLDGLRGLAILLVLEEHWGPIARGWIGVDLFFVLSGFLITTILLDERDEPRFWAMFYTRRAARILPPFLIAVSLAAIFIRHVQWGVLWPYILFTASDMAFKHSAEMDHSHLGVLWSLSVEEHFYMIWPVLIRRCSRTMLVRIAIALIAVEPLARVIANLQGLPWQVTYCFTLFRLDGLAMGSLLALALQDHETRRRLNSIVPKALVVAGVVLMCSIPFLNQRVYMFFVSGFGYSLLALTSALTVCFLIVRSESQVARLLESPILIFFGRISYGLYLYHGIVVLATYNILAGQSVYIRNRLTTAGAAIGFAWLSYQYIEKPILRWARRQVGSMREEQAVLATTRG